jgi:hypothetical protein
MTHGRAGRMIGAVTVTVTVAVVALAAAGCGAAIGAGHSSGPGAGGQPGDSGSFRPPTASQAHYPGPLVPATGALLGAYVKPVQYVPAAQITAVQSFEHQVGHKLPLVHVYHPWTSPFPNPADTHFADSGQTLLLTWGGEPSTLAIIHGTYDAMIRERATAIRALHRPVLLEWRHEMDRPDLRAAMHSPADYVAAWKHIRAIFTSVGATNVSWVWCPTSWGFRTGRAIAYYPGNKQVDWICADAYSSTAAEPLATVLRPFLGWASHHRKPVIIGEFGVSGSQAGWASWFTQVGQLVRQDPQIKALAYFDSTGASGTGQTLSDDQASQPALDSFGRLLHQAYFTPATPADPRS